MRAVYYDNGKVELREIQELPDGLYQTSQGMRSQAFSMMEHLLLWNL
jgi:hypothetical protein